MAAGSVQSCKSNDCTKLQEVASFVMACDHDFRCVFRNSYKMLCHCHGPEVVHLVVLCCDAKEKMYYEMNVDSQCVHGQSESYLGLCTT